MIHQVPDVVVNMFFTGHPGLDLDVGEFLDNLQLNNLKEIFEKEQVRNCEKSSQYNMYRWVYT